MTTCLQSSLKQFQNVYVYGLCWIVFIHFIFLFILDAIHLDEQNEYHVGVAEYCTMSVMLAIEWIVCIYQSKLLYRYLFLTGIKPILCLYVSKVIAYSDIYLLLYKIQSTQFYIPINGATSSNPSYMTLSLLFFNYSAATQTCTGVADIVAIGVIVELFAILQVLLLGITYNIFILSLALLRFSEYQIDESKINYNYTPSNNNIFNSLTFFKRLKSSESNFFSHEQASSDLLNFEKFSINQYETCLKYHQFTYKYMLLITVIIELPKLIIVYFVCCRASISLTALVMDVIILLLWICCMIIKLRLVKLIGYAATPNVWTLVGAYISTLLLFSMVYFDLWLLTKELGNKSAFRTQHDADKYWAMFVHFLYFSMTIFTSHGSSTVIQTWTAYAYFIQGLQMLLAVLYVCIVFGIGLLYVDVERTIATEEFIASRTSQRYAEESKHDNLNLNLPKLGMDRTDNLIKAGLVRGKVINMLTLARQKSNQSTVFGGYDSM